MLQAVPCHVVNDSVSCGGEDGDEVISHCGGGIAVGDCCTSRLGPGGGGVALLPTQG